MRDAVRCTTPVLLARNRHKRGASEDASSDARVEASAAALAKAMAKAGAGAGAGEGVGAAGGLQDLAALSFDPQGRQVLPIHSLALRDYGCMHACMHACMHVYMYLHMSTYI